MKRRVVLVLLMLLIASSAFAQSSWAKSYNKNGQFNLNASIGWAWGFTGAVELEFIITEFKIGNVPFDLGVMAAGTIEFYDGSVFLAPGYTGIYWGAGPLVTLHLGLSIPLEFFISAGVGFYGWAWSGGYFSSLYPGFGVGFASIDGVIWHFSPNIGLLLQGGYIGAAGVWGIGVEIQF